MRKKVVFKIKDLKLIGLLIFLCIILFLELKVIFTTPVAFGDEGFHLYLSQLIAQEKEYFVWLPIEGTTLIHKPYARPPLWNLLLASFISMGEWAAKLLPPFLAMLVGLTSYLLIKRLMNWRIGFFAAIISTTMPSVVTYSVLFYTDMLYTFYATLTFLLFLLAQKENSRKYFFLSGVCASLAILTKAPGFGFYAFFTLAFLYEIAKKKTLTIVIKKYALIILPLVLISSTFFFRNLYYYNTFSCYRLPYISHIFGAPNCKFAFSKFKPQYKFAGKTEQIGTEMSVYKMGIINYLEFAYGVLWFIPFSFLCGIILVIMRKEWYVEYLLLYFLLLILLFPAIVRRAEDTARYSLGWVPLISLVAALWYESCYEFLKNYHKYLVIIVFLFLFTFAWKNFIGKLTIMEKIKKFSPTFFEACEWVKHNIDENSTLYTIWAHRAVYNCRRNAIPTTTIPDLALSKNITHILKVAKENNVTHLFIQKFNIDPQNRHYSEMYDLDWVQFLENNPTVFVKIYENGPSFNLTGEDIRSWIRYCYQTIGSICDGNVIYKINYAA